MSAILAADAALLNIIFCLDEEFCQETLVSSGGPATGHTYNLVIKRPVIAEGGQRRRVSVGRGATVVIYQNLTEDALYGLA